MTAQIACTIKSAIYLSLLLLFCQKSAHAVAVSEDVNSLAENAKSTAYMFTQESFDLRLRYQYNGCSLNNADREKLYALAAKAADQLRVTAKLQQSLKNKIESYQEPDWEDKYGKTGLWKKLVSDIYVTSLSACNVDFYRAVAAPPAEKSKILLDILAQLDSLDKSARSPDAMLLKAKTTSQLARTEPAYKPSAIHQLNSLANELNIPESIRFATAIEKINFLGNSDPQKVDELFDKLAGSPCRDDLELVLPLAFFKHQKDPSAFGKIVEKWPQAQGCLAPLVLDDILGRAANERDITMISTFDVELAALAAWKNNPPDYASLLEKFTSIEKFKTPLVLYVAAVACTDACPRKSISLLIQAAKLQQTSRNSRLDIEPQKIAEQAARLAYSLFLKDSSTCPLAAEAFQNYSTIASDKADVRLEYSYASVLNQCGQPEKAKELLKKIAAEPDTGQTEIWHKRAALDLIVETIPQNSAESAVTNHSLDRLASFIAACPADKSDFVQLRNDAITVYCQLLLEAMDAASAQKALDILNNSETNHQPMLTLLKSKALLRLNNFAESASVLLDVPVVSLSNPNDPNSAAFYSHAMELLSQIVEKIDSLQEQEKTFAQMIRNCKKIAQVCFSRLREPQKHQAGLYLAEITIFSDEGVQEKFPQIDKLLADIAKDNPAEDHSENILHCQARLLTARNKFEQAAELWSQIGKTLEFQHSERWWQAKFFELYCAANVPKIPKKDITHSIEVLQNSFSDIPPFWAKKLKLLKQKCLADINTN